MADQERTINDFKVHNKGKTIPVKGTRTGNKVKITLNPISYPFKKTDYTVNYNEFVLGKTEDGTKYIKKDDVKTGPKILKLKPNLSNKTTLEKRQVKITITGVPRNLSQQRRDGKVFHFELEVDLNTHKKNGKGKEPTRKVKVIVGD